MPAPTTCTITGTIYDPMGAVAPNSYVRFIPQAYYTAFNSNIIQNNSVLAKSNNSGAFSIAIVPGNYYVEFFSQIPTKEFFTNSLYNGQKILITVPNQSGALLATLLNTAPATTQGIVGIPNGGLDNQVLAKVSNNDYDVAWVTSGGGGPIVGPNYGIAAYDSVGNIGAAPGLFWNATSFGLNLDTTLQPNNDGGLGWNNYNLNIDPLQNSPAWSVNGFQYNIIFDPNSTGFSIGTGGNAANLFSLAFTHLGKSNTGTINLISSYYNIGNGTDPIDVKGIATFLGQGNINNGVNISQSFQGYGFQYQVAAGATMTGCGSINAFYDFSNFLNTDGVNGYFGLALQSNFAKINNNSNYTGINITPQIGLLAGNSNFVGLNINPTLAFDPAGTGGVNLGFVGATINGGTINYFNGFAVSGQFNAVTINNGVTPFADQNHFFTGSSLNYYTSFGMFAQFDSGVTLGQYQGINHNATFNTNVTGNFQLASITANGTGIITNVQGMNINVASLNSPNQKQALNLDGGSFIANTLLDSSQFTMGPATQGHYVAGTFKVAAGSPLSGPFVFGTSTAWSMFFDDNMGVDITGGLIGFAANAYVGQISVKSGKLVDSISLAVAGCGLPAIAGDGGTVDKFHAYSAVGVLPQGGNLTINELYAYRAWGGIDLTPATNKWGVSIESAQAENYMQKSLVLGGTTKKVSNNAYILEIQGGDKVFQNSRMNTTVRDALTGLIGGEQIFNIDTNKHQGYDGTSWNDMY